MEDVEHATAIRNLLADLHDAIKRARKDGLTVKLELANMTEIGRTAPNWVPAMAVDISRKV